MNKNTANYICEVYADSNSCWNTCCIKDFTRKELFMDITTWDGKRTYLCSVYEKGSYYQVSVVEYGTCRIRRASVHRLSDIVQAIDFCFSQFELKKNEFLKV